jgi:hypothetical protein
MPSRGQNGGAMNESFAQHSAQTPSPWTGSRQETHSVGSAMSSASRAAYAHALRHAFNAPRRWVEMGRDGDASASMSARLAAGRAALKPAESNFHCRCGACQRGRANARPLQGRERKSTIQDWIGMLLGSSQWHCRSTAPLAELGILTPARRAGESPAGRRAGCGPRNRANLEAACCRKSRNPQVPGC